MVYSNNLFCWHFIFPISSLHQNVATYSRKRLLWIFMTTFDFRSPMTWLAMGLVTPELSGLPPGERGLKLIGDVWLMGDISALIGVLHVPWSTLEVFELTPASISIYIYYKTRNPLIILRNCCSLKYLQFNLRN